MCRGRGEYLGLLLKVLMFLIDALNLILLGVTDDVDELNVAEIMSDFNSSSN